MHYHTLLGIDGFKIEEVQIVSGARDERLGRRIILQ